MHLLGRLAWPSVLVLLVLGATWKLTLGDRIIARGDLLLYFYPLRDYASQAIREGRLPLWNPYTFMGAPFLANSQVGFFYPFNVLTAWLPVERAVSWNIALHLAIAALGAYALARRGFALGRLAAFAGAVTFGLGGYLGAQVEHLNQLQALAWLPLSALIVVRTVERASWSAGVAALALVLALQILAGHMQSLYISLVTLGLIALILAMAGLWRSRPLSVKATFRAATPLCVVVTAAILAAAICGIQLLPTLELSRESARAGGLPFNEAASFSWRPWVAARALMPTYGDPLFPEYVAYLGAGGLALALLGGLEIRDWRLGVQARAEAQSPTSNLLPLILVVIGFVLALGLATPLFGVLYRFMPGFNLFRAQARWLVVFALGAAMLVAFGVQRLQRGLSAAQARDWLIAWLLLMGLWGVGVLAGVRFALEPEYRALPDRNVMMGWIVALGTVTVWVACAWRLEIGDWRLNRNLQSLIPNLFFLILALELLAASQFQPYARASDRQALISLRPATAHLLAEAEAGTMRTGRILALSSLFFDPGDKVEQELLFGASLSADEIYDRLIAAKHKEIMSPNLSLYYRLPGVDGYDGGLLPTRRYAEFVRQFAAMPAGTVDGRLREFLDGPPANRWFEQMAVRYLIADKTQDVFLDGVYYDLLFSVPITPITTGIPLRPFPSTALGLVLSAEGAHAGEAIATAEVRFSSGETQTFAIRAAEPITPYFGTRLSWEGRKTPLTIFLRSIENAEATPVTLRGMTGIDEVDGTFLSQMVTGDHDMRLVHSGDVKIYENLRRAPRVAVQDAAGAPIDIRQVGGEIVEEQPEFVRVRFSDATPQDLLSHSNKRLILRDACFPGWVARVDGVETPIVCVDTLFRAVALPAGAQEVTFSYEPQSVRWGFMVSAAGVVLWLALVSARFKAIGAFASHRLGPPITLRRT
ncbi:MAG: hypothetical protein CUN48_12165 [Candidatus Thermofonsia Clade 3 bacterium]|uniref:YfhO family protein n=1 Tax=Candidatus Thermofonsia Clade 3 bacterium TaxID=2364212 RepID=A0A2M8QAG3_9CHLR|nr:MAG: hypothetical protein CUN48_12165 [Candidatus Thermofonsia Clade 3 bacterium]